MLSKCICNVLIHQQVVAWSAKCTYKWPFLWNFGYYVDGFSWMVGWSIAMNYGTALFLLPSQQMTVEKMHDLAALPSIVQKWSQNFPLVGAAILHVWSQSLCSSDSRWNSCVTCWMWPWTHPPSLFTYPIFSRLSADGFTATNGSLN